MASSTTHETQNQSHIIDLVDDVEEFTIPQSLKFMLDALKILTLNPLSAENHLVWTSQVESIFHANGYQRYLDPKTLPPPQIINNADGTTSMNPNFQRWNLINRNLIAALVATISPSIQPFVLRKESVSDLWNSLKIRLQSTTRSRIIQLKEELHSLNMKEDNMTTYLTNVKKILDQLEATGIHVEDEDTIIYIMNGLPPLYNGFKTAIRIKNERMDLNTFYSLLISEELNISRQHKAELLAINNALSAQRGRTDNPRSGYRGRGRTTNRNTQSRPPTQGKPPANQGSQRQSNGVECQICHKMGHQANKCWYRYHDSNSSQSKAAYISEGQPSSQTNQLPSATGNTSQSPEDWYLDSGATAHLTNQFSNLQMATPYTGTDSITVGNGNQMTISH